MDVQDVLRFERTWAYACADTIAFMRSLPANCIHCIVTPPPYYGLRDYGVDGQIGLEETPQAFIAKLVDVFRECMRILHPSGVLWLNMGDSYCTGSKGRTHDFSKSMLHGGLKTQDACRRQPSKIHPGWKPKDMMGMPWRLAFALQETGWYLRSDCIWCLSGGTRVYAKTQKTEGPMTIKDLSRLDPKTVKLWNGQKWTQLLGVSRSPRTGTEIEIKLRSGERISSTRTHQWPTQRGLVLAGDLAVGDVIETCTLPEPENPDSPSNIRDDVGRFIGLYLAEGSMSGDTIQISGHMDESEERYGWLSQIAASYGGKCRVHYLDGKSSTVNIDCRVMNVLIEKYLSGRTSHDKRLSPVAWKRSNRFLTMLLQGYLEGDGHYDSRNDRWRLGFTRNYGLEADIRTLCARLDCSLTLNMNVSTCNGKEYPSHRGEIRFSRGVHHNQKERAEIVSIGNARAREFYDLGVEDEPHLFALSSGVLTHNSKTNAMPESVPDRPSKAHEYIFMLSKSPRYFYDQDSCRTPQKSLGKKHEGKSGYKDGHPSKKNGHANMTRQLHPGGAAVRTIWSMPVGRTKKKHFATFPKHLVRPCVRLGSSAKGCCPTCLEPWVRVVKKVRVATRPGTKSKVKVPSGWDTGKGSHGTIRKDGRRLASEVTGNRDPERHCTERIPIGWKQNCKCDEAEPVSCLVFDPFLGSGTTIQVAVEEGRRGFGVELNPEYCTYIDHRMATVQPCLFGRV